MHGKSLYTAILSFLACVILQGVTYSQIIDASKANDLVRFQSDNGEFSIEMPADSEYFYDKDGFFFETPAGGPRRFSEMQMLSGVSDRTYTRVEIYRVNDPKGYIEDLVRQSGFEARKIEADIKGITARTVVLGPVSQGALKRIGRTVNFEAVYAASKTHIFLATVWNRGNANSISKAFLSSIRFNTTDASQVSDVNQDPKRVLISSIRPVTIRDIGGQMSKDENLKLPERSDIDFKNPGSILFLHSPWAGNIMPTNNSVAKGNVALMVTYGPDATVKRVLHMSGLRGNSSRNAFFAVLRTKFLPEESEGKPISTDLKIVYKF